MTSYSVRMAWRRSTFWLIVLLASIARADTSSRLAGPPRSRSGHGAISLANGDVLVTGGRNKGATSETYNARTGVWTPAGELKESRFGFSMVRLNDNRAMAIGGYQNQYLSSCEIYEPGKRSWTVTGSLKAARGVNAAEVLPDGRVLVAGGFGNGLIGVIDAEIYDPRQGTWSPAPGNTLVGVIGMAPLSRARVLACGGETAGAMSTAAEVFDGATKAWKLVAPMNAGRAHHSTVTLPDGRVLVFGNLRPDKSAELYDPAKNEWSKTEPIPDAISYAHATTLLPDGRVLTCGNGRGAQMFDPKSGKWTRLAPMGENRVYPLVATLPDGRAIVMGGGTRGCEVYDPKKDAWSKGPDLTDDRRRW